MRSNVILNSAMSLDGRTRAKDETKGKIVFSNKLDNQRVKKLRGSVDAILIDSLTVLSDDPEITGTSGMGARQPYIVIVDNKGDTPLDAKILNSDRTLLVVSGSAKKGKVRKLEEKVTEVITSGEYVVNLDDLLWILKKRDIKKILLEGGGPLCRRMLNEGHVSEIYITVAPFLIGDGNNLLQGELDTNVRLSLDGIVQYGDVVVLHYMVKH